MRQERKFTPDDLGEEEQVDGLIEGAGALLVRVQRIAVGVQLPGNMLCIMGVTLVDFARQALQWLPVLVLGVRAGRGRNEAACGQRRCRACRKYEAWLQAK